MPCVTADDVDSATVGRGTRAIYTRVMAKKKSLPTDKQLKELRDWGLATYPGTALKSPWPGHLDLAVNDKTYAYLSVEGEPFSISCKLPKSSQVALMLPFCRPTAYGLGKSGWVSAQFPEGKPLPIDMLKEWIDESYRAQAPKTLIKQLDGGGAAAPAKKPAKKAAAPQKTTKKTTKSTKSR
jgi:hypothetical protein